MNWAALDLHILLLFNGLGLDPIFDLPLTGVIYSVYGFILILLGWYWQRRRRRVQVHLIMSLCTGFVFVNLLKYLIGRPRPYQAYPTLVRPVLTKPDPAFPSAHTFIAFLCMWFLPRRFPRWARAISLVYLMSIPIISMYLGVHWPSDVMAGAALGWIFPLLLSEELSNCLADRLFKFKKLAKPARVRVWLRIGR